MCDFFYADKNDVQKKHLELIQKESFFYIQINTLVGRISLLFDHPVFNWALAKDLKNVFFKTSGRIRLVPLRHKDLFIMEDINSAGFKAQNFVYVSEEVSRQFVKLKKWPWIGHHFIEFLTKSISVFYVLFFLILYDFFMNRFGTDAVIKLGIFFGPPGMMVLPSLYYHFWSSKTKSSFLKFLFRFELMMMITMAILLTVYLTLLKKEVVPFVQYF
jgi:hypothetical protein